MTREQAIEAARQALAREHTSDYGCDGFGHKAESMVDALEALGLIEFSDPVQEAVDREAIGMLVTTMTELWNRGTTTAGRLTEYGAGCILEAIRNKGFKIVRAQ